MKYLMDFLLPVWFEQEVAIHEPLELIGENKNIGQ